MISEATKRLLWVKKGVNFEAIIFLDIMFSNTSILCFLTLPNDSILKFDSVFGIGDFLFFFYNYVPTTPFCSTSSPFSFFCSSTNSNITFDDDIPPLLVEMDMGPTPSDSLVVHIILDDV